MSHHIRQEVPGVPQKEQSITEFAERIAKLGGQYWLSLQDGEFAMFESEVRSTLRSFLTTFALDQQRVGAERMREVLIEIMACFNDQLEVEEQYPDQLSVAWEKAESLLGKVTSPLCAECGQRKAHQNHWAPFGWHKFVRALEPIPAPWKEEV